MVKEKERISQKKLLLGWWEIEAKKLLFWDRGDIGRPGTKVLKEIVRLEKSVSRCRHHHHHHYYNLRWLARNWKYAPSHVEGHPSPRLTWHVRHYYYYHFSFPIFVSLSCSWPAVPIAVTSSPCKRVHTLLNMQAPLLVLTFIRTYDAHFQYTVG